LVVRGFKWLIGSSGADVIDTNNQFSNVQLGGGDATVKHVARGTVVNAGTGKDTFVISDDVLITGATAKDIVKTIDGRVEHGGLGNVNSESVWATGPDGTKYAKNVDGELVIKDAAGHEMFVANYKGGPGVPLSNISTAI
jgi:hypothetical protein